MTLDIAPSLILRILLAAIFLRAAWHKVGNRPRFVAQLSAYRLLPESWLTAVALSLILIEVSLAVTLLIPGWPSPSFFAAALLSLYAVAMGINLAKGNSNLDCGCGGPAGFSPSISYPLIVRNGVLALLAVMTALPLDARALTPVDIITVSLASIAACLMYYSIEQAIVNRQRERHYFAQRTNAQVGTPL